MLVHILELKAVVISKTFDKGALIKISQMGEVLLQSCQFFTSMLAQFNQMKLVIDKFIAFMETLTVFFASLNYSLSHSNLA